MQKTLQSVKRISAYAKHSDKLVSELHVHFRISVFLDPSRACKLLRTLHKHSYRSNPQVFISGPDNTESGKCHYTCCRTSYSSLPETLLRICTSYNRGEVAPHSPEASLARNSPNRLEVVAPGGFRVRDEGEVGGEVGYIQSIYNLKLRSEASRRGTLNPTKEDRNP